MESYRKQSITIEEQITTLKKRGLHFKDEANAVECLKVVSYFRLNNYWKPFESDKVNHVYKPDSYFEDVVALYNFDKELRGLLFSAIQSIEIALRTKVIQLVSPVYGPFWFADRKVFHDKAIFQKCLCNLTDEIKRSKEDFLTEHFKKYNHPPYPPAWKTLEVSSFGTLSKLYCNIMDVRLKKRIAKELGLPQHVYLESWVKSLSVLRNMVAHHSRIWNRKFAWKPQMPKQLNNPWIVGSVLPEKLYAQLCCVSYLLDTIHSNYEFKQSIRNLINKYKIVDVAAMGFPKNWLDEPLWKVTY